AGALWPIYALTATAAGLSGLDRPARSAAIPSVGSRRSLPAAYALWQILLQVGAVAGPAVAGLMLARVGLAVLYWLDALSFGAAFVAVNRMAPLPPMRQESQPAGPSGGRASIFEGSRFAPPRRELVG